MTLRPRDPVPRSPTRPAPRASRVDALLSSPSLLAEARTEASQIAPLADPSRVCLSCCRAPPDAPAAAATRQGDEDPTEKFSLELETKQLGELQESRDELLSRVSHLKRDLQDWRFKLDTQVKSYRSELGDLRKTLNSEVTQLRDEFADLRQTLKQQLEAAAEMAAEEKEDEEGEA